MIKIPFADIVAKIKEKANFMTMQELITNTLGKCVLYAAEAKKGKAGGLQKWTRLSWSIFQGRNEKIKKEAKHFAIYPLKMR